MTSVSWTNNGVLISTVMDWLPGYTWHPYGRMQYVGLHVHSFEVLVSRAI